MAADAVERLDIISLAERMPCLCNAAAADFFVTALGECCRRGFSIDSLCSLNARELAEQRGFNWAEVCLLSSKVDGRTQSGDLAARWNREVAAEWARRARSELTCDEHGLLVRVSRLQALVSLLRLDGRFRVYGELADDQATIALVTEFVTSAGDSAFWDRVADVVVAYADGCHVLRDGPEDINDDTVESGDRQVEIGWLVTTLNDDEFIELLMAAARDYTEKIFEDGGVNVV